jgi:phosphatidate phosphatase APP1
MTSSVPDGPAAPQRPLAVVDIDGVVADVRHRLHLVEGRPKRWEEFFAAAADDPPLPTGVALVRELAADHDVLWLTGRPERTRRATQTWLAAQRLPAGPLLMRAARDFRPARVTKREALRRLRGTREVGVVLDDDPEVVALLRADGFPVRLADWVPHSSTLRTAQERDGRT